MTELQRNISIGLPVYNGGRYIKDTIQTILDQDYPFFELILADNCSNDMTEKICRDAMRGDERIRYYRHKSNIGFLSNFYFTLHKAKFDCFMWIAADDQLADSTYLSKLISALKNDIDYVFPEVKVIDENNSVIEGEIMDPFRDAKTKWSFTLASLRVNSYQVYGLYRTKVLKADFRYLERCRSMKCFGEGLFVHAVSATRVGLYVPAACKLYRRHGANMSSVVSGKQQIPDFINYFTYSISYFLSCKQFSVGQRYTLIIYKFFIDIPYFSYIFASALIELLGIKRCVKKFIAGLRK